MKKYKGFIIGLSVVVILFVLLAVGNRKTDRVILSDAGTEIPCLPNGHQQVAAHIHPILTITTDGEPEIVPANIGIEGSCMREVHTHDVTGTIHVETKELETTYTLGDFFAVWGRPAEREGYSLEIIQDGEGKDFVEDVVLTDHSVIALQYLAIE